VAGSSAVILDTDVLNNTAEVGGGGIAVEGVSPVVISDTRIYSNTAIWGEGGGIGGGGDLRRYRIT